MNTIWRCTVYIYTYTIHRYVIMFGCFPKNWWCLRNGWWLPKWCRKVHKRRIFGRSSIDRVAIGSFLLCKNDKKTRDFSGWIWAMWETRQGFWDTKTGRRRCRWCEFQGKSICRWSTVGMKNTYHIYWYVCVYSLVVMYILHIYILYIYIYISTIAGSLLVFACGFTGSTASTFGATPQLRDADSSW